MSPSLIRNIMSPTIKQIHQEETTKLFNEGLQAHKQTWEFDLGNISDGHHTFDELYEFRKMYNAALFNEWARSHMEYEAWKAKGNMLLVEGTNAPKYNVHKSLKHSDGEWCFGEEKKWFIVSAMLPTGLISNHYKIADWDLFRVPEVPQTLFEYDGHTGADVLERLKAL